MTHETITHKDVNRFAWYTSRKEALNMAAILRSKGIQVYIGGKRARNSSNYLDIKIAAIYHNAWVGSEMPWVIAWHD
jgi:hypothetical protein